MEMVTGQKVDFEVNYLTMLPFPRIFVIKLQDLGNILQLILSIGSMN